MNRDNLTIIFLVATVIILLVVITLMTSLLGAIEDVSISDSESSYDMLDYLVPDDSTLGLSSIGTSKHADVSILSDSLYLVRNQQGGFQRYHWDDDYIYLDLDMPGLLYSSSNPGFSYLNSNGRYLARRMKIGDTISPEDNTRTEYVNCRRENTTDYNYSVTLEEFKKGFDLGGDLGVQDLLIIKYDYQDYKLLYFSRKYGLVQIEYFNASGDLLSTEVFNDLVDNKYYPWVKRPQICEVLVQATYQAQIVDVLVAKKMGTDTTSRASVRVKNIGNVSWEGDSRVSLGLDETNRDTWSMSSSALNRGEVIAPGGEYVFEFDLTAPMDLGTYDLGWSVALGGEYFPTSINNLFPTVEVGGCMADFDNNGIVNANDLSGFVAYYNSLNNPSEQELQSFLSAYQQGCGN